MKKTILSLSDREALEDKLCVKYKNIGSLRVDKVHVFQNETVNTDLITSIIFYYGFLNVNTIQLIYYNDELFSVTGHAVEMKFIEELKDLLKED